MTDETLMFFFFSAYKSAGLYFHFKGAARAEAIHKFYDHGPDDKIASFSAAPAQIERNGG